LSEVFQGNTCRQFQPSDSEEGSKDPDPVLPSNGESAVVDEMSAKQRQHARSGIEERNCLPADRVVSDGPSENPPPKFPLPQILPFQPLFPNPLGIEVWAVRACSEPVSLKFPRRPFRTWEDVSYRCSEALFSPKLLTLCMAVPFAIPDAMTSSVLQLWVRVFCMVVDICKGLQDGI